VQKRKREEKMRIVDQEIIEYCNLLPEELSEETCNSDCKHFETCEYLNQEVPIWVRDEVYIPSPSEIQREKEEE